MKGDAKYMIWQDFAIDELKKYLSRQISMLNLEDRIKELNSQLTALTGNSDSVARSNDHSHIEDKRLNIIVAKDELLQNYKTVKRSLERVNRGLEALDERERKVLNSFYIHRTEGYIDRLCDELYAEKSTIYRIKDQALYKFTIAMYGVVD